jgi:hypothetical protein
VCVCDGNGFWACDEEGSCGRGHLYYERTHSECGPADDDHSSDPTPTSFSCNDDGSDGQWYCTACSDYPGTIHFITPYEDCCRELGVDADGNEIDEEEIVEERCETDDWVWLMRANDGSMSNVQHLRDTDPDFPEELGKLYERRSITRLLVTGERASEVVEWMGHAAVTAVSLTDEEHARYVPNEPEPPREEDAQCRLTV